jgi:hypothetical protein
MGRNGSDHGAVLIHVALMLFAMFVFTGFVVDYGTFWVSRNQAQNAADAGALAGATARLYDDTTSPPASTTSGIVYDSVMAAATRNFVWGSSTPSNTVNIGWTCPDANSSVALPTFFLSLAGVSSQGTKAHAVAEVGSANGTTCMRHWFLVDPDFVTPADYGQTVQLHEDLGPSGYSQLNVGGGGSGIRTAIEQCTNNGVNNDWYIGAVVGTKPGGTQGPEAQGVKDIIDWDKGASVSGTGASTQVVGSCATSGGCTCPGNPSSVCPNGPYTSPRVAVVPLCDGATDPNCAVGGKAGGPITITNFLTFFITGCNGVVNDCSPGGNVEIDATLIGTAGSYFSAGGSAVGGDSFLKTIYLVR